MRWGLSASVCWLLTLRLSLHNWLQQALVHIVLLAVIALRALLLSHFFLDLLFSFLNLAQGPLGLLGFKAFLLCANDHVVIVQLGDKDGVRFNWATLPLNHFQSLLNAVVVMFHQVSCNKASGKIVSSHAINEHVCAVPPNNRLNPFAHRIKMSANVLSWLIWNRNHVVGEQLRIHWCKVFAKTNYMRDVAFLEQVWILSCF